MGNLEKMIIIAYSDEKFTSQVGDPFTAYINPDKYSHTYKIKYNETQAQGSSGGSPDYNKTPPDKMNFELVFDGTGVLPMQVAGSNSNSESGIAKQIKTFKELVFSYNGNIHSPNYLMLSWGTMLFKCRLTSLSISYTLFKPDGTPLRAKASLDFIGYTDEITLEQKARSNSPDLTHVRTVTAGDLLPLMCHRIYGSSRHYMDVARYNDLDSFRDLVPGTVIYFPPLQSQAS
ncbi:MAG: LysM peptidoglycan-binding domain-containing protein [Magnetococcales bacterium]|nr:LysM peptidoglycan-binding domain-containing protein [Magnetococcales bacterium]